MRLGTSSSEGEILKVVKLEQILCQAQFEIYETFILFMNTGTFLVLSALKKKR